jgi:cysteinyl-tRNA synthetase
MMRVYNTLGGQKEEFKPVGNPVRMYVCGVTPYDEAHLGHAMSYIIFDVVRRYLEFKGYRVKHVQNFTDVDDKLIARAERLSMTTAELAERNIAEYYADMDALNIKRADVYPRATEEIPQMIELVDGLIQRGNAYESNGDVYYRVNSKDDYGKLSRRTLDGMMAGARIESSDAKETPMDFTLWKAAKSGEPAWESPWGKGRPGWHIECSAMALRYLGESIDIHGGGQDLVFPHHENEIAQSESYTGVTPFVRYWMHNGLMQLGEEKMSKSLGNLITVKEGLARFSADALRLFVLGSHYRRPLTYSEDGLAAAQRGLERLRQAIRREGDGQEGGLSPDPFRERFLGAMDDDFNTAQAIAVLFDLAREINRGQEAGASVAHAQTTLKELAGGLGLTLSEQRGEDRAVASEFIDLLVTTRTELRKAKHYDLADQIRERLGELGVVLEDASEGTQWRFGRS